MSVQIKVVLRGTSWSDNDDVTTLDLALPGEAVVDLLTVERYSGPLVLEWSDWFSKYILRGPTWDNPFTLPYEFELLFDLADVTEDVLSAITLTTSYSWNYEAVEITVFASVGGGEWKEVGFGEFDAWEAERSITLDWSAFDTTRRSALYKNINRTYTPGSPGVPAHPGQQYRPARWVTEQRTVCSYGPDYSVLSAYGWTYQWVPGHQSLQGWVDGAWQWLPPENWTGGVPIPYTYACRTENYQVYVPAQPYIPPTTGVAPTPAQTILDYNIGWTGRARSRASFLGSGQVRFKIPRNASGAVVGLNTEFNATGYADIRFAFYCTHGIARIMERGQVKEYLGPYDDEAVFRIRRHGGKITYFINDVQVWESPNDSSSMFLDAALYTGGDIVYDPEIEPLSAGEGSLLPLAGSGYGMQFEREEPVLDEDTPASFQPLFGEGWGSAPYGASGHGSFQPLTGSGSVGSSGHGSFLPLAGLGSNFAYASSEASLEALTVQGEGGGVVPAYAVSSGVIGVLIGGGSGLTGEIGSSAGSLLGLAGLGSEGPYGESNASLAPMTGSGTILFEDELLEVGMFSMASASTPMTAVAEMIVVMISEAGVESVFALQVLKDANMMSVATVQDVIELQSLIDVLMFSVVSANSLVPMEESNTEAWVMNTENNGFTRYENYPFNSFAKIGDLYYGARADGIYVLEGDDDDGSPVRAMVSFGKHDFDTSALKRVMNCYVGMSSSNKVFLKVIANGQEYIYASRGAAEHLQSQRIDPGKGIKATYLEFELYNADGADLELDSVEFVVMPLSRRL